MEVEKGLRPNFRKNVFLLRGLSIRSQKISSIILDVCLEKWGNFSDNSATKTHDPNIFQTLSYEGE